MPHSPEHARPTVMVVEDFEDTRQMIALELRSRGFRVVEATEGREALEMAKRERPDLVVMDLSLPGMDGLSAAYRMREAEATRDVPIVACSAHSPATHLEAAKAVGCDEYIAKPVNLDDLNEVIHRLLSRHKREGGRERRGFNKPMGDEELTTYIDGLLTASGR